jgi:hypothetical protein
MLEGEALPQLEQTPGRASFLGPAILQQSSLTPSTRLLLLFAKLLFDWI